MNAPIEQPAKADQVKPADYNQIVGAARLRDIRLLKSEFSVDPEAFPATADLKLSSDCEIQDAHFDADSEILAVWVVGEATCKKKNKKLLSSRCRYVVIYDVSGKPEEPVIALFAKRVARFAVYPYFRAHFSETCSQAGLVLPPLPIIKETKLLQAPVAAQLSAKTKPVD
jgi:preprotein translocase subunit SecB